MAKVQTIFMITNLTMVMAEGLATNFGLKLVKVLKSMDF